jgi:hypothetical protein
MEVEMISKRKVCAGARLLVLSALVLAAGFSAAARAGGLAGSFTDPVGDANGAPDITAVAVSDTAATGAIQFTLTASGLQGETFLLVILDTDKNAGTGQSGNDYALYADDSNWDVMRWDGADWKPLPDSPTLGFSRSGDTLTWRLNKSELGGTSGFAFAAVSALVSGGEMTAADRAPDGGTWAYELSTVPPPPPPAPPVVVVKPVIGAAIVTPAKPSAGQRVTVSFPVKRSDTGQALTSGKMICDPSVAGKVLPHAEHFTGGFAKLSFLVPKSAKGKLLKVKVTIKLGTQSTTRIASYRVR